jgi:uncharacterized protein YndB with AHSA1/START domain
MAASSTTTVLTTPSDREIVFTRVFNAPRDLVFKVYTDPKLIPQWWGPRHLTTTVDKMDVRPGGLWRFVQHMPNGSDYASKGVYREIVPPERIVGTFEFEGRPGHVAVETATFEDHDGKTKLTLRVFFDTVEDRDLALKSGAEKGAAETQDRLSELLGRLPTNYTRGAAETAASGQELVITRFFDAPRELVWKAWTDPEWLKRWWGPAGFTAPSAEFDLRVGGKYLFCMRSPDGKDYWLTGVYREIVPMERFVSTGSFADEKGNVVPATYYGMSQEAPLEMLLTVTFEEHDGKTKMTLRQVGFPSVAESQGAEQGWNQSFDKLAEDLAQSKVRVSQ